MQISDMIRSPQFANNKRRPSLCADFATKHHSLFLYFKKVVNHIALFYKHFIATHFQLYLVICPYSA